MSDRHLVQGTGFTRVEGTGVMRVYGAIVPAVLAEIPPIVGTSVGVAGFEYDLAPYQTARGTGFLQWTLRDAPATLSIDGSGRLLVPADTAAVGDAVRVQVRGIDGRIAERTVVVDVMGLDPVRYLRIQRKTLSRFNDQVVTFSMLEAWSGSMLHVPTSGVFYPPNPDPTVLTPDTNGPEWWAALAAGDITTRVLTANGDIGAYVEVDFGTYVPVETIRVVVSSNRNTRMQGTALQVCTRNRVVLAEYDITTDIYMVDWVFSIDPRAPVPALALVPPYTTVVARASDIPLPGGSIVHRWPRADHRYAFGHGLPMGSGVAPVLDRSENVPHVTFRSGANPIVDGGYVDFGAIQRTPLVTKGFTAVVCVRPRTAFVSNASVFEVGFYGSQPAPIALGRSLVGSDWSFAVNPEAPALLPVFEPDDWQVIAVRLSPVTNTHTIIGSFGRTDKQWSADVIGPALLSVLLGRTFFSTANTNVFARRPYADMDVRELRIFNQALDDAALYALRNDVMRAYDDVPIRGLANVPRVFGSSVGGDFTFDLAQYLTPVAPAPAAIEWTLDAEGRPPNLTIDAASGQLRVPADGSAVGWTAGVVVAERATGRWETHRIVVDVVGRDPVRYLRLERRVPAAARNELFVEVALLELWVGQTKHVPVRAVIQPRYSATQYGPENLSDGNAFTFGLSHSSVPNPFAELDYGTYVPVQWARVLSRIGFARMDGTTLRLIGQDRTPLAAYNLTAASGQWLLSYTPGNPALIDAPVPSSTLWIRAGDLRLLHGAPVFTWPRVDVAAVADPGRGLAAGTGTVPTLDTASGPFPFVSFRSGANPLADGGFIEFGRTRFPLAARGFSAVVCVRRTAATGKGDRIFECGSGVGATDFNIVLHRNETTDRWTFQQRTDAAMPIPAAAVGAWEVLAVRLDPVTATRTAVTVGGVVTQPWTIRIAEPVFARTLIGRSLWNNVDNLASMDLAELRMFDVALSDADLSRAYGEMTAAYLSVA